MQMPRVHWILSKLKIWWFKLRIIALSLSHTEHTAYMVGHPCKPYIQPCKPYIALSELHSGSLSVSVKAVYDFKTLKKLTRVPFPCIIVLASYKTVRDRVRPYETVYTTAHEVHSTSELNGVNIVYKSYGVGSYVNPVNVELIE